MNNIEENPLAIKSGDIFPVQTISTVSKKTLDMKEKVCITIPKDEIIKVLKVLEGLKRMLLELIIRQ